MIRFTKQKKNGIRPLSNKFEILLNNAAGKAVSSREKPWCRIADDGVMRRDR